MNPIVSSKILWEVDRQEFCSLKLSTSSNTWKGSFLGGVKFDTTIGQTLILQHFNKEKVNGRKNEKRGDV